MRTQHAIDRVRQEYEACDRPWVIGFSGGKDSSLVVKLVYQALRVIGEAATRPVSVVYCDTGVEIPVIRGFVYRTLASLAAEAKKESIPIRIKVAIPAVKDRFFVKVIGRGYPPPTNKFRWCTDRLRVQPIQRALESAGDNLVVVLGVRFGESAQRDRTVRRHGSADRHQLRQSGKPSTRVFAPIIDFTTEDVWKSLLELKVPRTPNSRELLQLYRYADGECPVLRDDTSKPCAGARFGCWTCTVVRKDKAVEGLVSQGFNGLEPLLEFRNWLAGFRDDRRYRATTRRNGAPGPGPITMEGRKIILGKLLDVQGRCGYQLISREELEMIETLWRVDEGG